MVDNENKTFVYKQHRILAAYNPLLLFHGHRTRRTSLRVSI